MIDKSLNTEKVCTCGERSGGCNSGCACSGKCNSEEIEFPPDDDEHWGTTSDIGVETERVPSISLTDILGESFFEQLKDHLNVEQECKVIKRDNEPTTEPMKNIGEMDVQIVNFSNKINNENKRIYIIKMKVDMKKKTEEEIDDKREVNEVTQFTNNDLEAYNKDDISKNEEKSNQTCSICTDNSIENSSEYYCVNAIKRTEEEIDVKQPKLHLLYISEKTNKTESSVKSTEEGIILINSNNEVNVKENDEKEQNSHHTSSSDKQEKPPRDNSNTESDKIQILNDIKQLLSIDNGMRVFDMDRYNKFVYIIQSEHSKHSEEELKVEHSRLSEEELKAEHSKLNILSQCSEEELKSEHSKLNILIQRSEEELKSEHSKLNILSQHSEEEPTINSTESPNTIKMQPSVDKLNTTITSIGNFIQEVIDDQVVKQINIDTERMNSNSMEFYQDILPEESIASEQRTRYNTKDEFDGTKVDNIWTSRDIFIESPIQSITSVPILEELSLISVKPAPTTSLPLPEVETLSSKLINIVCSFFHSIKNIMHYNTPESSENSSIMGAVVDKKSSVNSAIEEIHRERIESEEISECSVNEPHVFFYDMTKINSRLLWTNSPFFDRCMYVKSFKETSSSDEFVQKNPLKRDKKSMDLLASVQDATSNSDRELNSDELTQTTLSKDVNLTIIVKTDGAIEGGDLKKVFSMHRNSKNPNLNKNIKKDSNFYIFVKKEQINKLVDSEDFSLPINQSSAKLKDKTSKTVDKSLTARVLTDKLDKCTNTRNAKNYRKIYCY